MWAEMVNVVADDAFDHRASDDEEENTEPIEEPTLEELYCDEQLTPSPVANAVVPNAPARTVEPISKEASGAELTPINANTQTLPPPDVNQSYLV
jgi:hypothetical protein